MMVFVFDCFALFWDKEAAKRQQRGSREAAKRQQGGSREAAGRQQGGQQAAGRQQEDPSWGMQKCNGKPRPQLRPKLGHAKMQGKTNAPA